MTRGATRRGTPIVAATGQTDAVSAESGRKVPADGGREAARRLFPEHWAGLSAYADLLAGPAVERGLLGPREVPRLWDRHLVNCAVVADLEVGLVPSGSSVIDVGSGAGLPGLVWALVRPDLQLTLVDPLLRRSTFLAEAVAELGLQDRVHVIRGRAEELVGERTVPVVTARAVAPLDRLLSWTFPLLAPEGVVLALKGANAEAEISAAETSLRRLGAAARVVECGAGVADPPARVVVVERRTAGSTARAVPTRRLPR
ncbi:MAG: 16S rRNA (guanine(527)-N(7))-methyltransferase RsmG [Actinomycetota bacterium]|nr:MAG: 16S rRNA (guanine(527)-N(7))-methyltransferase RsmG [Actinomycetota bacterium]